MMHVASQEKAFRILVLHPLSRIAVVGWVRQRLNQLLDSVNLKRPIKFHQLEYILIYDMKDVGQ